MFCQSCGAKNTDDARFCNMCGTSLARAGEAGGPIEDASDTLKSDGAQVAPPAASVPAAHVEDPHANTSQTSSGFSDTSMLGVSLAGIGVRSNKKTWAVLSAIAVALVAAGALASYLARGEPVDGHAEADDPFVIGSPLPEGDGRVDAVTGTAGEEPPLGAPTPQATNTRPRSTMRSGATMRSTTGNTTGSTAMSGAGGSTAMSGAGGSTAMTGSGGSTAMRGAGGSTAMSGSGSTGGGSGSSSMNEGGGSGSTSGSTMSGSTMAGSSMSGSTMSGDPIDELPPERDLSMELYSSRVRFLIRRYYGSRAQTCFDRATRNNPNVSGTVVIAMSVGGDGQVTRARVARNSTGNEVLGNCLSSQVSSWRLSAPPDGPVEMQIPFSR